MTIEELKAYVESIVSPAGQLLEVKRWRDGFVSVAVYCNGKDVEVISNRSHRNCNEYRIKLAVVCGLHCLRREFPGDEIYSNAINLLADAWWRKK